ncbi:hypothetical protein [Mangrovimonas futianensis]|uniref:hypothetical protein n=1 Tax=Mangrovimonas futianensis TaxID=2895523 RepID=UPI001E5269CA|nr:hypothetical protein [Mangrovimonas futianensis]MCF1420226.1 hypothetical protein [Mangrovimonas futianensis]
MKTFIQILALGLMMLSCTVYKNKPVSLETASDLNLPSKVQGKSGAVIKFKRIIIEDGKYYGVKEEGSNQFIYELKQEEIREIKVKDKKLSTALAIIGPAIVGGIIVLKVTENEINSSIDYY